MRQFPTGRLLLTTYYRYYRRLAQQCFIIAAHAFGSDFQGRIVSTVGLQG